MDLQLQGNAHVLLDGAGWQRVSLNVLIIRPCPSAQLHPLVCGMDRDPRSRGHDSTLQERFFLLRQGMSSEWHYCTGASRPKNKSGRVRFCEITPWVMIKGRVISPTSTTENTHPAEETSARSLGLDLLFNLVRHYCDPKIILHSGNVVVKSRSYIACRLLSSLCTMP